MTRYELSLEDDLLDIFQYSIEQFGLAQAERYRAQFERRFQELADNPKQYPAVDEIRVGYRRSVCGVHAIYYRERATHIEIMRIYGQQDPENL